MGQDFWAAYALCGDPDKQPLNGIEPLGARGCEVAAEARMLCKLTFTPGVLCAAKLSSKRDISRLFFTAQFILHKERHTTLYVSKWSAVARMIFARQTSFGGTFRSAASA